MALADILKKLKAKMADDSARPQAGIRFGMPWPLLAALCIILVCAVAWAFFMGLMVGRGQSPHSEIAAITGLEASVPEAKSGEQTAEMIEAEILPVPVPTEEAAPRPSDAQPKPAPPKAPAQAARKPASNPAQAARKPATGNERFDYVFQAGAYRSQSEANDASARLVKSGFRASVRKSGKVWLIIVNLRGSQKQVDSLTQAMKSIKMGKPMQLSRKEIGKKR